MGIRVSFDDDRERRYVGSTLQTTRETSPSQPAEEPAEGPAEGLAEEQKLIDSVTVAEANRFQPEMSEKSGRAKERERAIKTELGAIETLIKSGDAQALPRAERFLAAMRAQHGPPALVKGAEQLVEAAKLAKHAVADTEAGAFDAIAARAQEERKYLDALKEAKTPQSAWALLNPATSIKMIAGHYDHLAIIHDENIAKLQAVEYGAKIAAVVMRRHDLSIADLERMDTKALSRFTSIQNALAIKECLSYARSGAPAVDASYLETEVDVISKSVGEQVRGARAHDEHLKKSSSAIERAVGNASAMILDGVSTANAEAKEAFAVANKYWTDPSRKESWSGRIGHGATFAGEMLASTVTMPATIADARATDEERSQAITGTALMLGTMGVIKAGGPAWASLGNGIKSGAAAAMTTRPLTWIANSGAARMTGRAVERTAEVLSKAEARFEATALAKGADRAKAMFKRINTLPEIGVKKRPPIGEGSGEGSIEPIPTQGMRKTVGRSGAPTATPDPSAPHLAYIQRGIDRMPKEVRAHLEFLLEGGEQGVALQAEMQGIEAELRALGPEQANAQRALAAAEPGAVAKLDALVKRGEALAEKYDVAAEQLGKAQSALKPQAAEVMDYYLNSIRRSTVEARKLAAEVPIEKDAIDAVAKNLGRTPKEAEERMRSWLTDYFETADPRVAPKELRLFFDPKERAYYRHGAGINVGAEFDKGKLFHEMTHPIEYSDPAASAATKSWRDARATAIDPALPTAPLRDLSGNAKYKPDEIAYAMHDFVDDYVGKIYTNEPMTEVLTMFAEQLSTARNAANLFARDPEHFFLGLGLLK